MIHSRVDLHRKPNSSLCSVDPISMAVGGAMSLVSGLFGGGGGGSAPQGTPAPAAPAPQAAPQRTPAPKPANAQGSTFIGGVPAPPPSNPQKTLLGQ